MKEALVMLGRVSKAHVRPPLMKLNEDELKNLSRAIDLANISETE
jgi:4-hydroxy-tetrahydrodipicolinate synthase